MKGWAWQYGNAPFDVGMGNKKLLKLWDKWAEWAAFLTTESLKQEHSLLDSIKLAMRGTKASLFSGTCHRVQGLPRFLVAFKWTFDFVFGFGENEGLKT